MYMGERPTIGGTSPRPLSSAPWQMAHRMVLPSAPVVTISSPFLTLPVGTWATKPVRGSRLSALRDRKSTRLNSSHGYISYAVFCLKKKKKNLFVLLFIKKNEHNN